MTDALTIRRAVKILKAGGLVAFPTETVYGLGADASNAEAVKRIFAAKGRPVDHPLIVHIGSATQIVVWARDVPTTAWRLAEAFWPGPLTMILRRARTVCDAVTGGQDTIGLRVPAHRVALSLLREFGGGIAAPSANRFGRVSPTSAAHVVAELGDAVDLIVDGGSCSVGIESTIVDLTGQPRILRPGKISREAIEAVLSTRLDESVMEAPRVSGALQSHYAPHTPVRWVEPERLDVVLDEVTTRTGVIALRPEPRNCSSRVAAWRTMSADPALYAQDLYAQLRALDELRLDQILIEEPPDVTEWEAVRDRLRKAAGRPPARA